MGGRLGGLRHRLSGGAPARPAAYGMRKRDGWAGRPSRADHARRGWPGLSMIAWGDREMPKQRHA